MAKDESKEIDTEVCENISHFAVGVHGATDHFCRDPGQEKSSSQHRRFHLLLTLKGKENQCHVTPSNPILLYMSPVLCQFYTSQILWEEEQVWIDPATPQESQHLSWTQIPAVMDPPEPRER